MAETARRNTCLLPAKRSAVWKISVSSPAKSTGIFVLSRMKRWPQMVMTATGLECKHKYASRRQQASAWRFKRLHVSPNDDALYWLKMQEEAWAFPPYWRWMPAPVVQPGWPAPNRKEKGFLPLNQQMPKMASTPVIRNELRFMTINEQNKLNLRGTARCYLAERV